jgi:hypothetical protein
MKAEISVLWEQAQGMMQGFMAILPNIVIALIVFIIFVYIGTLTKRIVKRITRHYRHARNLGMVSAGYYYFNRIVYISFHSYSFTESRRFSPIIGN